MAHKVVFTPKRKSLVEIVNKTKEELYAFERLKNSPLRTSDKYKDSLDAPSPSQPNKKRT
jgi:hypothetical protein